MSRAILTHYIHISVGRDLPGKEPHYLPGIVQSSRHYKMPEDKPALGHSIFIDYQVSNLPASPHCGTRHTWIPWSTRIPLCSAGICDLKSGM